MADISFIFDSDKGFSDLSIVEGDFLLCDNPTWNGEGYTEVSSLQVSIELALFTDRRATREEIRAFQSGIIGRQTRRGYWANSYKDNFQGSGLWLLSRAKKTNSTLAKARAYINESLKHFIDSGIIGSVSPVVYFENEALIIEITVTKPDGYDENFNYQFTWDALERI